MNLGKKITELRKNNNLSQEELAEKIGVTRQTISKWELEETSPDINQAKKLSKVFNISLDELTNNDVKSILVEKVSNTEKLAGIIIKILKIIGILFVLGIILIILGIFTFSINRTSISDVVGKYSITCSLDDETYLYEVEYDENFYPLVRGGDDFIDNHMELDNYDDANQIVAHIEDYFKEHNGTCDIKEKSID